MTVNVSSLPRPQFFDQNGNPVVGGKLFTYLHGTTTKQATYTDSVGNVANSNPIILDSEGRTPYEIRLTDGVLYKLVLAPSTDTDPPTSGTLLGDNVSGVISDVPELTQWVVTSLTPTYTGATTFTLVGDQTNDFQPGRRVKAVTTGGTRYGTITTSVYTTLTTVTLRLDSGSLDAGLSTVDIGVLTFTGSGAVVTRMFNATRTANTVLGSADAGTVIDVSGSYTQTINPANGLGNGWWCIFRNTGGSVTIDPNSSETIDNELTLTTYPGDIYIILCDGSGFNTKKLSDTEVRNSIINGEFSVGQRGATFAACANSTYVADRWIYGKSGAVVHTVTKEQTGMPTLEQAGIIFRGWLKCLVTTADISIAASDYCILSYKMEGYDFARIAQRKFTLSFWVKSTVTGAYTVAFRNGAGNIYYTSEYNIDVADTWEYKKIIVSPSPSAGTWDYYTDVGLRMSFCLSAGTNSKSPANNTWAAGSYYGGSSQVNGVASVNNIFGITGVQVTPGINALLFKQKSIVEDHTDCFRYYWRGQPALAWRGNSYVGSSFNSIYINFPVRMRAAPTMSNDATGVAYTACAFDSIGDANNYGAVYNLQSTGVAALIKVDWAGGGFIEADAELT